MVLPVKSQTLGLVLSSPRGGLVEGAVEVHCLVLELVSVVREINHAWPSGGQRFIFLPKWRHPYSCKSVG